MDDTALLALCVWSEAAGESVAGKRAVAQVILNRMARKYHSDGTVAGTVLAKDQFSGFYWEMIGGKYTRVCWTLDQAREHAETMLLRAQHQAIWDICLDVAVDALQGALECPAGLDQAVLYLNPSILPRLPPWATSSNELCAVGHHVFYRDAA
jgi:spore germination cell wall hydrolase CwlJ-like protein